MVLHLHLVDLCGVSFFDLDGSVTRGKWLDADLVFVLEDKGRLCSVHQEVDVERAPMELVRVKSFLED